MENKKVRNARESEYDGIKFKSELEKYIYKNLVAGGFNPRYEPETFVVWKGVKPATRFYTQRKNRTTKRNELVINSAKLQDIEYTPDFVLDYEGIKVIIEAKGFPNELYTLRRKLFRAYLETLDYPVVFAEIHSIKHLRDFIEILKNESNQIKMEYEQRGT